MELKNACRSVGARKRGNLSIRASRNLDAEEKRGKNHRTSAITILQSSGGWNACSRHSKRDGFILRRMTIKRSHYSDIDYVCASEYVPSGLSLLYVEHFLSKSNLSELEIDDRDGYALRKLVVSHDQRILRDFKSDVPFFSQKIFFCTFFCTGYFLHWVRQKWRNSREKRNTIFTRDPEMNINSKITAVVYSSASRNA